MSSISYGRLKVRGQNGQKGMIILNYPERDVPHCFKNAKFHQGHQTIQCQRDAIKTVWHCIIWAPLDVPNFLHRFNKRGPLRSLVLRFKSVRLMQGPISVWGWGCSFFWEATNPWVFCLQICYGPNEGPWGTRNPGVCPRLSPQTHLNWVSTTWA